MSVESVIAQGRVAAESRMTDTCTIGSSDATPVWNPNTEQYDVDPDATVYSGKCRVKMPRAMTTRPEAGETVETLLRPEVHIPADVDGVESGQVITITAAAFNPSLPSAVFRVASAFRDSQATAQRLECTEVQ